MPTSFAAIRPAPISMFLNASLLVPGYSIAASLAVCLSCSSCCSVVGIPVPALNASVWLAVSVVTPYPSSVVGSTVACMPYPSSVVGSTVAKFAAGPLGANNAETPDPVVAAVVEAIGLLPNRPPTVVEKSVNKELSPDPPPVPPPSTPLNKLLMVPNALSMLGKFVVRLPNPKPGVTLSVDPGSCGIPSLARMYGSVGSALPSSCSCLGVSPAYGSFTG